METKRFSTVEAALAARVPRATLRHWVKTGKISAPPVQLVDGKAVRLWTEKQIREIRKLKGKLRPGPKRPRRKRRK